MQSRAEILKEEDTETPTRQLHSDAPLCLKKFPESNHLVDMSGMPEDSPNVLPSPEDDDERMQSGSKPM